jgi:hypothetical protein
MNCDEDEEPEPICSHCGEIHSVDRWCRVFIDKAARRRPCEDCGRMFEVESPGQDCCSVRCTRAVVIRNMGKRG